MTGAKLFIAAFSIILPIIAPAVLAENKRTVINLNGAWEIAEGSMAEPPAQFSHRVPVPGVVDMARPQFAEVGLKSSRREAFWYRRTFRIDQRIPAAASLKIHKAAFGTRVLLNGTRVGDHLPSFTPGIFDVREVLRGGGMTNELLIRVGAFRDSVPPTVPSGWDFEKVRYIPGIFDSVELILSGTPSIGRVQTASDIPNQSVRVPFRSTVRARLAEWAALFPAWQHCHPVPLLRRSVTRRPALARGLGPALASCLSQHGMEFAALLHRIPAGVLVRHRR